MLWNSCDDPARWFDMRVIAIDGPAGSGKSTVAKAVADRLGLKYLDTGAMYRSVAFAVLRAGGDPANTDFGRETVVVNGVDASVEIRGPEVTRAVSLVAANAAVRAELVSRQREWVAVRGGGVLEGRDIGTVVFPDAELKIYLTADPAERARRRANEVADLDYETVAADLARRDSLDTNREADPLAEAADAVVVDTTGLSITEVVTKIEGLLSTTRSEEDGE
jgi:cytidylate kinase